MSPIPVQKTTEASRKPASSHTKVSESKKSLGECALKATESTPRPTAGEGETLVKKPLKKTAKADDDKAGKRVSSAIIDRVPKKNAQRAKGSTSLNKTIEKTNVEPAEKKQSPCNLEDKLPQPKEEGNVEISKVPPERRKSPVSVRSKTTKTKTAPKHLKPLPNKEQKLLQKECKKPWLDAMEKADCNVLEEKTVEVVNQEPLSVNSDEIRTVNPSFNSCSFFEKLQQGVKAYFNLRNSFTPSDKNKKEGGIRTRARVAKGVKEDAKKENPGLIFKNKIYNSESDLFYDQLRLNSSLGGQSSNFLSTKPKIFRKLKRKKLYHPKKHYVRIQIPRKGYFYRSTVQFKTPGSATSGPFQRLEPYVVPKNKSKVQISRLASTSPKISNLPHKKRLKKKRKDFDKAGSLEFLLSQTAKGFSPDYIKRLTSAVNDEKLGYNFEQKVNCYIASNWPDETVARRNGKKVSFVSDMIADFVNPEMKGERQISAISENLFSSNSQKTANRMKRKSSRLAEDFPDVFESLSERVLSRSKKPKKSFVQSDSSLETSAECFKCPLGREELIYNLEIIPINTKTEDAQFMYNPTNFQNIVEEPFQLTDIVTAFDNFDLDRENSLESETLYISPVSSASFCEAEGNFNSDDLTASLLGEIDLHLELQNYLKAFDTFNNSKGRTKNTLQCNFYDDYNSLRVHGSNFDFQNQTEEFFDVREDKSGLSFASATSICTQQNGDANQLHVFLDRNQDIASTSEDCFAPRPTKPFNSQTQFTNKLSEIRKIKSENDPSKIQQDCKLKSSIKRTFGKTSFPKLQLDDQDDSVSRLLSSFSAELSTENSIDSYEKILPFCTDSNKSCDETEIKNESSASFELAVYSGSVEAMPQNLKEAASDLNQSQVKSSDDAEVTEPVGSVVSKESSTSEVTPEPQPENGPGWSPTLQDLIEIYNSVLKQNKKIRRSSKSSVSNCFSSHLFPFLSSKLKEKHIKADLIKLSKNFIGNHRPSNKWKPLERKNDSVKVKEYVAMFQEILQSSLSINQIARLNNIVAGLQEYSERNYNFYKELKCPTKKSIPANEITKTQPKRAEIKQKLKQTPRTALKKQSAKETSEKSKRLPKSCSTSHIKGKKAQEKKNKETKTPSKGKIQRVELPSPTELELMLKSCFNSEGLACTDPEMLDVKNKILVTVKLCGNRVLVSGLSYFDNETALTPQKFKQKGTSELIIESVSRDQIKNAWYRKTKSSKLREIKHPHVEDQKVPSRKVGRVKVTKSRNFKQSEQAKSTETKTQEKVKKEMTKNPLPHESEPPKTIVQFEYDQMQLRAQHPIEAISESSESKIGEDLENSEEDQSNPESEIQPKLFFKDVSNNPTALKEALKVVLADNVFPKDLVRDFDRRKKAVAKPLGPKKSQVNRCQTEAQRPPPEQDKEATEMVRSMVDLGNRYNSKRKGKRATLQQINDYLYCPFLESLQDKPVTTLKKSKDNLRSKKLMDLRDSSKTAKSTVRHVSKPKVHKKVSGDLGLKRKKSNVSASKRRTSVLGGGAVDSNLEKLMRKPSSNTFLYRNSKIVPECCSIDLLFPDDTENTSPDVSSDLSVCTSLEKQSSKSSSEQSPWQVPAEVSNVKQTSDTSVEEVKESPIVLHPPRSNTDDHQSFPSMIIHSDSFLKCFSHLAVSKSQLESFFKSNSDLRFYPGKVTEEDENEVKPLITFVLTPSQKKAAGLSSDRVKIVEKTDAVVGGGNEQQQAVQAKSEEINDKIPLESIEKFIGELSKCRVKMLKQKRNQKSSKSDEKKEIRHKKKGLIRGQIPQNLRSPDRKPYHECQKRKKAMERVDSNWKKTGDMRQREERRPAKKIKSLARKGKSELPEFLISEMITNFSEVLENFHKNKNETGESKHEEQYEEKEEEKAEKINLSEKECKIIIEGIKVEDIIDAENEPGTKAEAKCNLMTVSFGISDMSLELLEALKNAISQAEEFTKKAEIIAAIAKELEKKQPKQLEDEETTLQSVCSEKSGKPKTFNVNIYCDEHKCWKKDTETEQPIGGSENIESLPPAGNKVEQVSQLTQTMGDVDLLDSLVMRETEGRDLENKNSAYFDAVEKTPKDDIGGAGEKMSDGQRIGQKPKGALDLNAEFGVEEIKPNSYPLLTPSDNELLSKDSLTEESEEIIFNKISKSLQQDNVAYSLALLDSFLKKAEDSSEKRDSRIKLRRLLLLVENKSKNLMVNIEINAWLKVLSLLEEVSKVFENEDIEESMKVHLRATKAFIDKIQTLNLSRLVDLQNFCTSLTQQPTVKPSDNHVGNVLGKISESLKLLKQKFTLRRSCPYKELDNFENSKNEFEDGEQGLKVHSSQSLPEAREPYAEKISKREEEIQREYLTKKIQQQKICIKQLMKADTDLVLPEIQEVKNIVGQKVKSLERMFACYNLSESPEKAQTSWERATSLLNETETCRKSDTGCSAKEEIPRKDVLSRAPGYVDLMQCLMKVWDARLSLRSFSSECYN